MKKSYTVFYITRSPGYGGYGYEILSFEGTKEEFLDVISKIVLTKYGCYKIRIVHDKKKSMYILGIKRRGRKKEFRVFIKDVPNK
ncbi:hypothetical protein [Bacillus massiliglaciei]|uniref:hypothetical protein n=1 Tax=Bacillus massiliglaciei TaxID=1816693 RepID=UPI000DA622CA|nr:hypothetical protein [Bacillus massiliglaciei]